jgi:Cu+-exporting ATPase
MHYCPESCREFLEDASDGASTEDARRSFHYRSAPIYLLTLIVGLLFGADILIGVLDTAGVSSWSEYREFAGFRLVLLAAVLGGARILFRTLEGLFEGRIGADLALTIACLAAIVLGEHSTAALVVFIALCGESIEGYTVDRAQKAIRGIFTLCPDTAHVVIDGRESEVPVADVEVGQLVLVRPGERVPIDGVIEKGRSAVDQSALTGESLPIEREAGDSVFAGTVNQFGAIEITATCVGQDTTLAKVMQLVAEAGDRKAPIEKTADRYARMFLPVVLGVTGLTLIGWWIATGEWREGLLPALSVLVVACPCPLILATPSAVMAAMAWLARAGIVVKGAESLERLASIDMVVFDKTGTLTRGEMQLGSVRTMTGLSEELLLRTAAIAERHSEHPIARLICREAEARDCVIPGAYDFEAFPGTGVTATVKAADLGEWAYKPSTVAIAESPDDSICLIAGNEKMLAERNVEIPEDWVQEIANSDQAGETQLIVAANGKVLGLIGLKDTVRESAADVIRELQGEGLTDFVILSGDRPAAVTQVADQLEIQTAHAEMLPADKADWIEEQTKAGRRIAMIGDGVNDAPALTTATVGIALGGVGSDIAAEAGDLVLMGDPLKPLPALLRLSRELVKTIRQSIFLFAFGLNGCGMILGASGILSPPAAAIFHEIASLAVMFNSLRLLWFERSETTLLGRIGKTLSNSIDRVVNVLSPTQLVFQTIKHGGLIARLLLTAVGLWWFLSNLICLTPGEQAVVTRFGKHVDTLDPGLHWRWPTPFESVSRLQTGRLRTITIGYRADGSTARAAVAAGSDSSTLDAGPVEWTSSHSDHGGDDLQNESLMLTADEVPVEVTAAIQYNISDPQQYVYASGDPAQVLQALSESWIRQVVASVSLDQVLTTSRRDIENQTKVCLQATVDEYGLGVRIVAVDLLDVHPPRDVVMAYRQVADALELKEQLVNEAEAYYARTVLSAAGETTIQSMSIATDGKPRRESTAGAVSDWNLDDEEWARLISETNGNSMILSGEAGARILKAREDKYRIIQQAAGNAERVSKLQAEHARQPFLTRTHMYWQTIQRALADRPITIVDPQVAGRQHLLLIDPDDFSAGAFVQPLIMKPQDDSNVSTPEFTPKKSHE